MMISFRRALLPALACLALTGCLLQPGKFDSTLDLHKDGTFTFNYKGQITMLALSKFAEDAAKADQKGEFVKQPCRDDAFKEHPCTAAELAEQKHQWEQEKQQKLAQDEQNAEAMRAMLGGVDPNDPKAAQQFADGLRRQAGWRSVTYVGDGLFEVDFAVTSKLTHDFVFPTVEGLPMSDTFVQVTRRQDGAARITAPGYSAQANPMTAIMSGLTGGLASAATGGAADKGKPQGPQLPPVDGIFRILTDGQILANNTDEGPKPAGGGQVLTWTVNSRTQAAPTALIRLAP